MATHSTIERVINQILPPSCREHVLGDLEEQFHATEGGARRYLLEALRTVPLVIFSQMRCRVGPRLLAAQALAAFTSFIAADFQAGPTATFWAAGDGLIRLAIPALLLVAVLILVDTYRLPKPRPPLDSMLVASLAAAVTWLFNSLLSAAAPRLALSSVLLTFGTVNAFCLLAVLRMFLGSGSQRPAMASGPPAPDRILEGARRFEKEIRQRTVGGIAIAASLILYFAVMFYYFPSVLQRLGAGLSVAALCYMAWQVYRYRGVPISFDHGLPGCLPVLRAELERQRDFHRGALLWLRLGVFLPGPALFLAGFALAYPGLRPAFAVLAGIIAFLGLMAVPLNLQLARRYQLQLERIQTLDRQP